MRLKEKAESAIGRQANWDAVVTGMCEAVKESKIFESKVEEAVNMPRMKCQVCGEILGSMKEVERHFREKHKTKKETMSMVE